MGGLSNLCCIYVMYSQQKLKFVLLNISLFSSKQSRKSCVGQIHDGTEKSTESVCSRGHVVS